MKRVTARWVVVWRGVAERSASESALRGYLLSYKRTGEGRSPPGPISPRRALPPHHPLTSDDLLRPHHPPSARARPRPSWSITHVLFRLFSSPRVYHF